MNVRGLGRIPSRKLAEHINDLISLAWTARKSREHAWDRGYYRSLRQEIRTLQTLIRENME